ncbi:MAG: hypothetical protein ACI3W9_05100 [Eubacteriales bacterium]
MKKRTKIFTPKHRLTGTSAKILISGLLLVFIVCGGYLLFGAETPAESAEAGYIFWVSAATVIGGSLLEDAAEKSS